MSKFFVLFICMNIFYGLLSGQSQYELSGSVLDENHQALTGATVFLYPAKKGAVTNDEGRFVIEGLPKGNYTIEISFIGYGSLTDTIRISQDMHYHAQLSAANVSLQEVVVTDNYVERRKKEESLSIEIVNEDYLKQNLGGSLVKSIERLPGVSAIDIGSGQAKPVIRGLGFNRVVVAENGIKHEAQQWGADHGLEIDQYSVENIEVIKGPASLMYGSDAIGGVIDMKNRKVPPKNSWGGSIDLSGKSNNDFLGTSVSLHGRKDRFFADARFTLLDYGDYKVPVDSVDIYSYRAALHDNDLRNTAGQERNMHLSFGISGERFQSRFYASNVSGKSGFFANAHGLEPRNVDADLHDNSNRDIQYPYQKVEHFKLINISHYKWEKLKLTLNLGFQRNFRQEWSEYVDHGYMPAVFPDTLSFNPDLEREFEKYVYSGKLSMSYPITGKTHLRAGLSGDYQDNRIGGRGFIIPVFRQLNLGAFAFSRHELTGRSQVQLGIRYDFGNLETDEYRDWFPSPVEGNADSVFRHLQRAEAISQQFTNFSWSAGYNYNADNWSLKANMGKSFRMPIAKELAANGVNYHHFRYEVGNPDLSPEISWQFDAGAEYKSKRFAIGATPFVNYFSNYIYLNPTAEHDRLYGNGNQVFNYTQSEVFRYGAELHAHYELSRHFKLGLIGEYVYSEQLSGEKKGFTLPYSPPPSAVFNIKYQKRKTRIADNAYLSLDYRVTAAQNDIVPPEEPTEGYQLINAGIGGDVELSNQKISISLQVQNVLNNKYFNHTSYYRLINVPEPGRNFIVNISVPFSGKNKQE